MTIAALSHKGLLNIPSAAPGSDARPAPSKETTALCFVFDTSYLHPFKILIYSLAQTRSFLDLPIYIITQDPQVANDPVVSAVSDVIKLVTDDDIQQFSVISGSRVPDRYKLDWIPKYTFLKWMLFDDYDCDNLLFIDADIVCLRNADDILSLGAGGSADLLGGPVFAEHFLKDASGNKLPNEVVFSTLSRMCEGAYDDDPYRLNSGVLKVRNKCLTKHFRTELLDFAEKRDFVNEQSYLTTFFKNREDYEWQLLPAMYNFGAGTLEYLDESQKEDILNKIVFLHYPGSKKPWIEGSGSQGRISHTIWKNFEKEAIEASSVFETSNAA